MKMFSRGDNGEISEKDESIDGVPSKRKLSDEAYFHCYENFDIHATMISDEARTMTYKRAILRSYRQLFKAVVADIGCGSGILSLFCVQAGARRVFAIEGSAFAKIATELADANGFQDRIEVMNVRAEEAQLPEKVDAIVSEWMGYGLLYENMLPSVIDFRDKFLKKGGLMFPQTARVFVAAIGDIDGGAPIEEIGDFWRKMSDRYKVNLDSTLVARNVHEFAETAHVELLPPEVIISHPYELFCLDLLTVTKTELSPIKKPFKIVCFGEAKLIGLALWFNVEFPSRLVLSTSPTSKPTHWEQVAMYFKDPISVAQDSVLEGEMVFRQADEFHRFMDISLSAQCHSPSQRHAPTVVEQRVKFREK